MIEVFKTNVQDPIWAERLTQVLHRHFEHFEVNFDLADCDNILRVASQVPFEPGSLIRFLGKLGFHAEVLPDHMDEMQISF